MRHNHKNHIGNPCRFVDIFDVLPNWKNRNPHRSPKSEKPGCFWQKTENQMLKKGKTGNHNGQQNRKTEVFLLQKPKNRPRKWPKPKNRKSQRPPPPEPHTNLDQTLAQISPPWPWVILYQFVFTMLGSLLKSIHIFGMECQTRLLEQEEPISRLPVENYVVFVVVGYWARWPDTGQHRNFAKILISQWMNVKKQAFFRHIIDYKDFPLAQFQNSWD